jgi:hypothetical protein
MKFFCWTFIVLFLVSACNTCNDCEPVTNNPSVKVNFRSISSGDNLTVILDTLNRVAAEEILLIGEDTTGNTFLFPIDLNRDTAVYTLTYFLQTDTLRENRLVDTLVMRYNRITNINVRRIVTLSIDSLDLVESSFESDTLICSNQNNCEGNAHTVRVFL